MLSGKGQTLKRINFLIPFIQNLRQEKPICAARSQNDGDFEWGAGEGVPDKLTEATKGFQGDYKCFLV